MSKKSVRLGYCELLCRRIKRVECRNVSVDLDMMRFSGRWQSSLQRSETLLWASGAALGLVDNDCLGLEAVFGPVSQVVQCDPVGVHGKQLLEGIEQMLSVQIRH